MAMVTIWNVPNLLKFTYWSINMSWTWEPSNSIGEGDELITDMNSSWTTDEGNSQPIGEQEANLSSNKLEEFHMTKVQNTNNQQEFVAAFGGQTRESTYRKFSAFAVK
jgi:hypothetical protein